MIGVERTERSNKANAMNSKIASGVAGRSMVTAGQLWMSRNARVISRDDGTKASPELVTP